MPVKGAGSVTITWNSNNITSYVNTASIAGQIAELDTTDFGSSAMEYIPGLADWTANLEIRNWDSTVDGYLMPDLLAGTVRTFVIAFNDGTNTVTYTWTSNAFMTAGTLGGSASELVSLTGVTVRCNGAPTRSVA